MQKSNIVVAGIAALAIISVSGYAFARGGYGGGHMMDDYGYSGHRGGQYGHHMGRGYGGHMMDDDGYDGHMGGGYGDRMGYGDYGSGRDLSDKQREEINQAREDFFKASREIRNEVYQKQLDMRSELAKENPEADKLRKIQKDLSGLEAELDQIRLAHELKINKIIPDAKRGYAGRGYGRGFGGRHME